MCFLSFQSLKLLNVVRTENENDFLELLIYELYEGKKVFESD